MKRKKFRPINIFANSPSDIFETHRCEIAKAIIEGISFGIRNKKEKVDFAEIIVKEMIVITLSIDSKEFVQLLDENIQTLVEYEEYELCAQALKLKNKINKANEKVTEKNGVMV
jgi:hypothetical protein